MSMEKTQGSLSGGARRKAVSRTCNVVKIGASVRDSVFESLAMTKAGRDRSWQGGPILVKPNLTVAYDPSSGAVTPPETVRAVVEWLRALGLKNIIVGDGSTLGTRSDDLFAATGYGRLCRELDVPLIDLNADETVELTLPAAGLLKTLRVSKTAFDASLIINIPVWKTHIHTGVTLGLKNLKGLLPPVEKKRCHFEGLEQAVADLYLLSLRQLVLADGSAGQEGLGPLTGTFRRAGYLVTGTDPLAVDLLCTWMMGLQPDQCRSLKIAAHHSGVSCTAETLDVVGPRIRIDPPFQSAQAAFEKDFPYVTLLDEGACSACLGGVAVALHRMKMAGELEQIGQRFAPVFLAVGPGDKPASGTVVRVGRCQQGMENGILVMGCPPQGWLIRDAFRGLLGLPPLFPEPDDS